MYLSITYSVKLSISFNLSDYPFLITLLSPIQKYYIFSKYTKKSYFVVITAHLLPLTNYLSNGQYVQVQPIASKFAERCICTILTTKWEGIAAYLLPQAKSSNKATLALHSFSKCSFTLSKLRFFELRAPKISACYTTSNGKVPSPRNSPSESICTILTTKWWGLE